MAPRKNSTALPPNLDLGGFDDDLEHISGAGAPQTDATLAAAQQALDEREARLAAREAALAAATAHPAAPVVEPPADTAPIKPIGMPKLTRIVVDESDDIPPTGLPIEVNGRAFLIRPSAEVDLPDYVLEVLDNARVSVPRMDPLTKRITAWTDRPRFPYRVIRHAA